MKYKRSKHDFFLKEKNIKSIEGKRENNEKTYEKENRDGFRFYAYVRNGFC